MMMNSTCKRVLGIQRQRMGQLTCTSKLGATLNVTVRRDGPYPVVKGCKSSHRHYATEKIVDVRKQLWEIYLSSGRGSNALFEAIDIDENGRIEPAELKLFMEDVLQIGGEKVDPRKIMPYAWNRLEQKALRNKSYNIKSFKRWLVAATKMSADTRNQRMMEYFEQHPATGDLCATDSEETETFTWNEETMSQSLRRMQYAVRGEVVMRADKLQSQGREILYTNIGNPHQVGQAPVTYYRQVLSLCDLPAASGVDHPKINKIFPADVVQRAREMRDVIGPAGTGAYTHSQGLLGFRKHVAEFIEKRDGYPSYPGNIFLTNGASSGIGMVLQGLLATNHDAVMIPIPQYPIYSALIAKMGGRQVGYELDEDLNWSVSREELEFRLETAKKEGLDVKALAMINPGNPSGNVMTHCDIQVLTEFCCDHGIVLLADEVYQSNVYAQGAEFVSAKKVALDCNLQNLQLVSFHSTSKGLIGECGRRGGYMELHHIDPYVQSQLYKLASSELCSGVVGQIMTSLMVRPPSPGEESYDLFQEECSQIFEGLMERSLKLVEGLNNIEGITCVPAEGAMYAFPKVDVPEMVFEVAKEKGTTPDNLYALSLLEETGICVVPASGFGQKKGRVGFRTTFLHPDTLKAIDLFKSHHEKFVKEFS
uniref:EF-hand domain-containing protein n=1 Tax=Corethron hystrix TaxID=216773 RepID=A0A7S1FNG6_9STRA|mmetsp:Transcript_16134/g.36308  ORF Transcript_16134/g.36308 Transcript_16134/m.36308 type:complete len:651 (+) Transcript_16134:113-2065(+)